MTRKKKTSGAAIASRTLADIPASTANSSITSTLLGNSKPTVPSSKSKNPELSTSALIICRNKHWRYISSFHGPWLQLPPEVLESLAYSNYASPHPRPIDPAVFFDLVKIRRLVEDATDLAVRAANGTTSSTLSNTLNAGNGVYGGGGAAALGLGISGGANAKLSRERKHRMRELATQKLSRAYHLDEIAASVATMQSASSLEEVAKLVLQRSAQDSDAKYVHFFHEKIPSRMLAQFTNLNPLDEIIQDRPTEGAPLRTRAVTKLFKDDFLGAARDLTDGLAICRYMTAQHRLGVGELELIDAVGGLERKPGVGHDYSYENKLEEEDQPSSLELQLLFHRAGVYLTLACQNVHASLDNSTPSPDVLQYPASSHAESDPPRISTAKEIHDRRLEARKMVKTNAKRALRDYISFLSHFKYTPGLSAETGTGIFRNVNATANDNSNPKGIPTNRLLEMSRKSGLDCGNLANALVPHKYENPDHQDDRTFRDGVSYSAIPAPAVYPVSALFSSSPPPNLPPFPGSLAIVSRKTSPQHQSPDEVVNQVWIQKEPHEAVTYHPLLTDALHSLLLCHSLFQTSSKEHLRHAQMAARLARICDGYPIFLAARSPSRADWIEVLRLANNWIGLQQSWETLCTPAPLSEHTGVVEKETEEEAKESLRQEAIMEALADERVYDETSFQAAVAARERRAEEQRKDDLDPSGSSPRRWAQEDEKEYPISTERAETVARWVREAPRAVEGSGKARKGAKKGKGGKETEKSSSMDESKKNQVNTNKKRL